MAGHQKPAADSGRALCHGAARHIQDDADRREPAAIARYDREFDELHYVISHDLQEPLRKITGFVGLLQRRYEGKLDADADEYIDYINDACDRMHRIIQDLLGLSRIRTRGAPFAPVETDGLVSEILSELQRTSGTAATGIRVDGELPQLRGDAAQLRQVFEQLLANAVKFRGPAPPDVRIVAERDATAWHFRIEDNGIGIDGTYSDKIFGIFQRLHTREEYPGTGIGLALCKKVIERHGGEIWVESQPGEGATFHFTIPDEKEVSGHVEA